MQSRSCMLALGDGADMIVRGSNSAHRSSIIPNFGDVGTISGYLVLCLTPPPLRDRFQIITSGSPSPDQPLLFFLIGEMVLGMADGWLAGELLVQAVLHARGILRGLSDEIGTVPAILA